MKTAALLLGGGIGKRMGGPIPKQYLEVDGKACILWSFDLFNAIEAINEIVVVCASQYRDIFTKGSKPVRFALPGKERQDSVYNGLLEVGEDIDFVCVHDGARPFVEGADVEAVIAAAMEVGAALLAVPATDSLKIATDDMTIERSLDRGTVWHAQTPQVVRTDWLREGFKYILERGLTITDDVQIMEYLGHPAKIVEGNPANIKITNPADLKCRQPSARHRTGGI